MGGDKIAEGRARKAEKKAADAQKVASAAAAEEAASWEEGAKKASKKQEAEAERRARAADRKALATEQEEAENAAASKPKASKGKKGAGPKKTRAEIAAEAMARLEESSKAEEEKKKEMKAKGGNEYMGVLEANTNKADDIDASGVDDAIAALELTRGASSSSSGPQRVNLKAAYLAFEERELPRLKAEQPGLKLSQYKERISEAWRKSPENPNNALGR